jgi:hypothetical protein
MPDFQKEKEKLFHVTKHDGEVVVRVYTLKNREECFSYSQSFLFLPF